MSDGVSFDFSELDKLTADLGTVPPEAVKNLRSAVQVTAFRVKKGAAEKVGRRKHFRQAAAAITYDTAESKSGVEAEIGYDKDRDTGKLGNLVEFGAPGAPNALTPGNELATALHDEEPDFVRGVEKALDDAHRKAGL